MGKSIETFSVVRFIKCAQFSFVFKGNKIIKRRNNVIIVKELTK